MAYIAELYDSTSITGETAVKYFSAINKGYEIFGLPPPGRGVDSSRLYNDVKLALEGQCRIQAGGNIPGSTLVMPVSVIMGFFRVVSRALDRENKSLARNGLANVGQFYMIF